jgi:hypothetical protein
MLTVNPVRVGKLLVGKGTDEPTDRCDYLPLNTTRQIVIKMRDVGMAAQLSSLTLVNLANQQQD